jgi:putative ABC transport system substrate-binding protein
MSICLRRREFIAGLGGAAVWPLAARAQQAGRSIVGYLYNGTALAAASNVAEFREGLGQAGYIEGRNVEIEFRFAQGNRARLPELAADLVRRQVAVIVASGGPASVLAAKATTSTIPIIFVLAADPVKYGIVGSLNRPQENVTGVIFLGGQLGGKRLNLLLGLVPQATIVGYLSGPSSAPVFEDLRNNVLAAARALKREIIDVEVQGSPGKLDFEGAFASVVQRGAEALVIANYAVFLHPPNRDEIVRLAARYKIPAIYSHRLYAVSGGLMTYSTDIAGTFRRAGAYYVGRILKGAKPSDLPVELPTKFQLVINLKTAKALGLTVPPALLAQATEVIE